MRKFRVEAAFGLVVLLAGTSLCFAADPQWLRVGLHVVYDGATDDLVKGGGPV